MSAFSAKRTKFDFGWGSFLNPAGRLEWRWNRSWLTGEHWYCKWNTNLLVWHADLSEMQHITVLENRYQWCECHFDYNGLLEMTEILIVRCIFELKLHQIRFLPGLRPVPDEKLKQRSPWPIVGWGEGHPSHPSLPLRRRAFQWGAGVVECVGPTRWLIRPCPWGGNF